MPFCTTPLSAVCYTLGVLLVLILGLSGSSTSLGACATVSSAAAADAARFERVTRGVTAGVVVAFGVACAQ